MTAPNVDPDPVRRPGPVSAGLVVGVLLALVLGLAACGGGSDDADGPAGTGTSTSTSVTDAGSAPEASTGTTAPVTADEGLGEGWAPERDGRTPLRGFGEVQVTITDDAGETCEVCLLAATDAAQRERGLMEVTDPELGGYDGMLFEYPDEIEGAFWMRNTPMPLSIAYFDGDRELVSTVDMAPCADEPSCTSYPAEGPFRYALEVPQGGLAEVLVADGSTFTIDARTCDT